MGRGMALNLLKADVNLVVFDVDPAATRPLVEAGATTAASVAHLTQQADVVFTSLPGPAQIEQVLLGAGGIVENMRPGLTVVDFSTSSPSLCRRLYEVLKTKGGDMLDAPVSGGPAGAASGRLAIWVGGDRAVFDKHAKLLQAMGDGTRYIGPAGAGSVTKLVHNMLGDAIFAVLAEGFSLGVKAGVDPLALWEALNDGSIGRNSATALLVNQFLPGKYEPAAFALKLAHKDVTLAAALGKELGVPLRLTNMVLEEMTEAMGRRLGEQDMRVFMQLQLERAGVQIAVDPERLKAAVAAVKR